MGNRKAKSHGAGDGSASARGGGGVGQRGRVNHRSHRPRGAQGSSSSASHSQGRREKKVAEFTSRQFLLDDDAENCTFAPNTYTGNSQYSSMPAGRYLTGNAASQAHSRGGKGAGKGESLSAGEVANNAKYQFPPFHDRLERWQAKVQMQNQVARQRVDHELNLPHTQEKHKRRYSQEELAAIDARLHGTKIASGPQGHSQPTTKKGREEWTQEQRRRENALEKQYRMHGTLGNSPGDNYDFNADDEANCTFQPDLDKSMKSLAKLRESMQPVYNAMLAGSSKPLGGAAAASNSVTVTASYNENGTNKSNSVSVHGSENTSNELDAGVFKGKAMVHSRLHAPVAEQSKLKAAEL